MIVMTDSNLFATRFPSRSFAWLLALPLVLLGCNQPPPPGSDGTETGEDATTENDMGESETGDTGGEEGSLYPLVDGAEWSYVVKSTSGQILGMDNTAISETTWDGMPAFALTDEPNANGNWSVSTLVRDGDAVFRVHREEMGQAGTTAILDYTPGFIRARDSWTTVGFMEEILYDRTEYDANGQNPMVEARGHTYEVLAINEEVTVPAGTFNCVKVERVRTIGTESGALAIFWYAPGVGKVREERPVEMEIEELVSVSIPGGVDLP
jgi:hypothetical protein